MASSGPDLTIIQSRLGGRRPKTADSPGAAEAAVAVVLAQPSIEDAIEILLIRRAVRQGDPWSGQMGLPGGRREAADETLLTTAIRETREETSIDLTAARSLGRLDDLAPMTPVLPPIIVRPFVFGLRDRPPVRANKEVAGYRWVPLEDLRRSVGTATVHVRGAPRAVDAYRLGPDVVWGMTHRILMPLLDLLDTSR